MFRFRQALGHWPEERACCLHSEFFLACLVVESFSSPFSDDTVSLAIVTQVSSCLSDFALHHSNPSWFLEFLFRNLMSHCRAHTHMFLGVSLVTISAVYSLYSVY